MFSRCRQFLLSELVRYKLVRQLGTQIDRCGRIRLIDVAACMLSIIDADCEHRTLKTRIKKFLAEPSPNPVEDDVCYHDAAAMRAFCTPSACTHFLRADFCGTELQAFLGEAGVGTSKRRRRTRADSADESAIVRSAASATDPTNLVPSTSLPNLLYFHVVQMNYDSLLLSWTLVLRSPSASNNRQENG